MKVPNIPKLGARSLMILRLLYANGSMYGLEMVDASDGALARGGLYVFLGRLEEQGLIQGETEKRSSGAGPPRRHYLLTPLGRTILGAYEALIRYMEKRS